MFKTDIMKKQIEGFSPAIPEAGLDQRGITGLETAIAFIAFVGVASVCAFAVLSTRLVSSEKSKETALGALGETSAIMTLSGAVIAAQTLERLP